MKPTLSGKIQSFRDNFQAIQSMKSGEQLTNIIQLNEWSSDATPEVVLEWVIKAIGECVQASTAVERKEYKSCMKGSPQQLENRISHGWNLHADEVDKLKRETLK